MERYKNIEVALAQMRRKEGLDPSLEITDGNGDLIENPTRDQLMELKRERNRVEWKEQKQRTDLQKSEERRVAKKQEKTEIYVNNSILNDAFENFWTDSAGNLQPLPVYDTPEQLAKALAGWEAELMTRIKQGDEIIPDAEGMCVALRITPSTMKAWRKGERGDGFREVIEAELNKIAAVKNQLAMKSGIQPVVWATMMNNVHGYTQAKTVELEVSAKRAPESAETLINSAKMLP
jgi:hypothetical protein